MHRLTRQNKLTKTDHLKSYDKHRMSKKFGGSSFVVLIFLYEKIKVRRAQGKKIKQSNK
jgi:hypothetical protein